MFCGSVILRSLKRGDYRVIRIGIKFPRHLIPPIASGAIQYSRFTILGKDVRRGKGNREDEQFEAEKTFHDHSVFA